MKSLQPYFLAKISCFWALFNVRQKVKKVESGRFLAKMASLQPYFLAKISCFWALFNVCQKVKKVENGRFLAKMASLQPYFLAKISCFWALFNVCQKMKRVDNGRILGKNGKPIALVFGKNIVFLVTVQCVLENEESLKLDDFWPKWQVYSLTFWPKYRVFGHFLICARK